LENGLNLEANNVAENCSGPHHLRSSVRPGGTKSSSTAAIKEIGLRLIWAIFEQHHPGRHHI